MTFLKYLNFTKNLNIECLTFRLNGLRQLLWINFWLAVAYSNKRFAIFFFYSKMSLSHSLLYPEAYLIFEMALKLSEESQQMSAIQ